MRNKPLVQSLTTESGAKLVRFKSLEDIFYYDVIANNPYGLGMGMGSHRMHFGPRLPRSEYDSEQEHYLKQRNILDKRKTDIINKARKELEMDKDFLQLVYKAKSEKRNYKMSKFGGNISIPHFAAQNEKLFRRNTPGAKKMTLDMAFQVGVFCGGNYQQSFVGIIKTILMCQALNINMKIDMFDSDTDAIKGPGGSYVICNVADSREKLNLKNILVASHDKFFSMTLFNGYTAGGEISRIGSFLDEGTIKKDLSSMYDVIGGNMLASSELQGEERVLIEKVIQIGWK